ncbi:MAG TPA: MFS transporter [Longimicrobiales bacterium]
MHDTGVSCILGGYTLGLHHVRPQGGRLSSEAVRGAAGGASASGIGRTLRALRHRNFRLFFLGQSISLVGTWMRQVAMSWLVYRLTESALVLGMVAFIGNIPAFLISPIAGVLADRWDRHRMVIATQVLSMVEAWVLTALVLTGVVEVWHVLLLAGLLGVVNGFDVPARQSFLVRLVDGPADLANAIALNSSMFNGARLVGPAIAGVLVGVAGEGPVFALNALSYLAVIGSLLAIDADGAPAAAARPSVLRTLREGFDYVLGFAPIRSILALLALLSLVGMPYLVLMPVFASEVLHGGPRMLGFLMGSAGLGALMGALYLASRSTVRGLGRMIAACSALFGAGLVAFSRSGHAWLSMALLVVTGFGMMVTTASMNTVLQTVVDEDKRGRVMSLYSMAFMGMAPFGGLLAGSLANRIGAPNTVLLGGLAVIAASLWFRHRLPALREDVRPIYERLGILPEAVARGLESATELRPKG